MEKSMSSTENFVRERKECGPSQGLGHVIGICEPDKHDLVSEIGSGKNEVLGALPLAVEAGVNGQRWARSSTLANRR